MGDSTTTWGPICRSTRTIWPPSSSPWLGWYVGKICAEASYTNYISVEFNARKLEVTQNLQKAIMRQISPLVEVRCAASYVATGHYLHNLYRYGISPYGESFERQSLYSTINKASPFPEQKFGGCGDRYCGCAGKRGMDLAKELRKRVDDISLKIGLCLDWLTWMLGKKTIVDCFFGP